MSDTNTMQSNFNPFPTERIINKLFLVGNGFDLSLGLKTRYEDFLFWYFQNYLIKCFNNNRRTYYDNNLGYLYNDDDLLRVSSKENYNFSPYIIDKLNNLEDYVQLKSFIYTFGNDFNYFFKSPLFKDIYESTYAGWVDIENSYYKLLKLELKKKSASNINKLNWDLKIIKKLLKEYLETLDYSISEDYAIGVHYIAQFLSEIKSDEVIDDDSDLPIVTNQMLFLNFNYTPALSNIIDFIPQDSQGEFDYDNCRLNHIHGRIHINQEDTMIFGYGDEMDKDYKEIEELNDNKYLENFKSFKYNHSSNYRDLLRFVNSDSYQVCIYGHSCGLSDRVMLNEIFEHDNCKSIKIYYYNKEEFINKNMDISRHFNSNKIMRQRIVEFSVKDEIPQIKNIK